MTNTEGQEEEEVTALRDTAQRRGCTDPEGVGQVTLTLAAGATPLWEWGDPLLWGHTTPPPPRPRPTMASCPDLGPAVVAAAAQTTTPGTTTTF